MVSFPLLHLSLQSFTFLVYIRVADGEDPIYHRRIECSNQGTCLPLLAATSKHGAVYS